MCRSANQPRYDALDYVPSAYVLDVMTKKLAILARKQVERSSVAH